MIAALLFAGVLLLPGEEILRYNVLTPGELSLGEAQFRAVQKSGRWEFEFVLEAPFPGFPVKDRVFTLATPELCAVEANKETLHGKRVSKEKITFSPQSGIATRETIGGGKSEIPIPACARDALTFFYWAREELAKGRVPAAQTVFFGGPYQIRCQFAGVQKLRLNEEMVEAEKIVAVLKGPASETTFEMYFARDAVRTPVAVKVPLVLGVFSMEIIR
jgi:hypothetical protein